MRLLLVTLASLVGCTSENVQPLKNFGPIEAYVDVELGPLAADAGREDVNPRVFVEFSHNNPDCPVFGDSVHMSIDGVRPDSIEPGYYSDGSGWGDNHDASCEPPYFSIDKVPPAKPLSVLRLADNTAQFSLEVDRLFVNPAMTLATPLVHGQPARIDVADDRQIKEVDALWWTNVTDYSGTYQMGYEVKPTIVSGGISLTVPSQAGGDGWLDVRVTLAAPELNCVGFSACAVSIKGSERIDAPVQ